MSQFKKVKGGICAPLDFLAGTAGCGIKNGIVIRDDLALVVSNRRCVSAATFTTNKVKAAPVRVSMEYLKAGGNRAVVLNSGNANACTGAEGMQNARRMAHSAANHLGLSAKAVLVCSTGRIGVSLPIARIERGISAIRLNRSSSKACARAIMTSDTFPKEVAIEVKTPNGNFHVGGIAKGAGMIDPKMATMLCVITTDAAIAQSVLRKILRVVVDRSFNRITVDGDMSTNDTVIVLANGASGIEPDTKLFQDALETVATKLAHMIVKDGEGVSKFVEVALVRAQSDRDARLAAEAVANSTLVKCAWAGGDPNWGRIMDALGYCGARLRENQVAIWYNDLPIVQGGLLADTPWNKLKAIAAKKEFRVKIDLAMGKFSHTVWTTDLTEKYVRLNLGE